MNFPGDADDPLAVGRAAARRLARTDPGVKARALEGLAEALERSASRLVDASRDLVHAPLTRARLEELAEGYRRVAALPDPVGRLAASTQGPDGSEQTTCSAPLGLVGLRSEPAPGLALVAAALALKTSNALVLAGPGAAHPSTLVVSDVLVERGLEAGLPMGFLSRVPELPERPDLDLLVDHLPGTEAPAGVPTLVPDPGPSGLYVDQEADLDVALGALVAGLGGARRGLGLARVLLHREILEAFLERAQEHLRTAPRTLHADFEAAASLRDAGVQHVALQPGDDPPPGTDLAPPLELFAVEDAGEALEQLRGAGDRALDVVATRSWAVARRFERESTAACVAVNAWPAPGGHEGLPAGFDLGVVAARRHARGPLGLRSLLTTRVVVRGGLI